MRIKMWVTEVCEGLQQVAEFIRQNPYPSDGQKRDEASAVSLCDQITFDAMATPLDILNRPLSRAAEMHIQSCCDRASTLLDHSRQKDAGRDAIKWLDSAWNTLHGQMVVK